MASFVEAILRSKDLLHFQLELTNFKLDPAARPVPLLKRESAAPAFAVLRLPAQHIAEEAAPLGATQPGVPYRAFLSSPSRITLAVPALVNEIPFTLDAILQRLTEWALHAPQTPPGTQPGTLIEFPDRLALIPETAARLSHAAAPPPTADWTPIWHTRLRAGAKGLRLRAVRNAPDPDRFQPPAVSTLNSSHRADIVTHCEHSPAAGIIAADFMLTALGATARLKSDWPDDPNVTLKSWGHDSVIGRDQYVETVERGFLFPFGHPASLTTISQREISGRLGGLVQRRVLSVQEAERRYDGPTEQGYQHAGREMPLKSVRIALAHSLPIDPSGAVPLQVAATDRSGHEVNFGVTMFFVRLADARNDQMLTELSERFLRNATVHLMGQRVTLADNGLAGSDTDAAVASLEFGVRRVDLSGPIQPPFLPLIRGAEIAVPAIEHLLGTVHGAANPGAANRVKMAFHPLYLAKGFSSSDNPKQIYAQFQGTIPGLNLPAERAGGLAAPTFPPIDGLSRVLGPVADVARVIANQEITAASLVGNTRLLGVIPLKELIADVKPRDDGAPLANFEQLFNDLDTLPASLTQPLLTTVRAGAGFETRFLWKPKIKNADPPLPPPPLPAPMKHGAGGPLQLVMKGRFRKGRNAGDAVEVEGVLSHFKLAFGSLLTLDFDRLAFKSSPGKKMQVDLKIRSFEFGDGLAFVRPVLKLLSSASFGNAFNVEPRPDGVVVRYGIGIPSFGLGAMNLEDIALSSSISLPFVEGKPAAVRVALSERSRPFLVSASLLGGTGFFAVEVRTDTSVKVEGAIELGGIIAINLLGIVKAGIYAFAGIYISVEAGGPTTRTLISGFVRWGGYADVLGLISVSIEFFVALEYVDETKSLEAEARLTIGVKVLFFNETFSFSIRQQIADFGSLPLHIVTFALAAEDPARAAQAMVSLPQWEKYCRAFA